MITLRLVLGADAKILFPYIHRTRVTDTIAWDGPDSLDEFVDALTTREEQARRGEIHQFTVVETHSEQPIGSASVRPLEGEEFRGDCGLWIAEKYSGRGYGTRVVRELMCYAFEKLQMEKLEASVYVGNVASRRIFEKNGFQLEGTIRKATKKRGVFLDDWVLGITREEYLAQSRDVR
jgi:[ribosomal protein S5]-alanine N-acetyltransferase